jgi:rhodanese-related sulfurtransferase
MIAAMTGSPSRRTIDDLVAEARSRIERLEPREAAAASERGARLIDLRSETTRQRDGVIPGSLHIPRTVLEWRFDPDSEWRSPYVGGLDDHIVLFCDHGLSSSLAAATLAEIGFSRVGDIIGGFHAWREAALPTSSLRRRTPPGELPGMGPPDP